jgi:hypothetical protein
MTTRGLTALLLLALRLEAGRNPRPPAYIGWSLWLALGIGLLTSA